MFISRLKHSFKSRTLKFAVLVAAAVGTILNKLTLLSLIVSEHLGVDDASADVAGLRFNIIIILESKVSRIFRDIPPLLCVLAPDFNALFGGAVVLLGYLFLSVLLIVVHFVIIFIISSLSLFSASCV